MDALFIIILFTLLVSSISLVGVSILVLKEKLLKKLILYFVAFGAGALLTNSFFHLIPEAFEEGGEFFGSEAISAVLVIGFVFTFLLENFIHWHHHHAKEHPEIKSFSWLILYSDTFHNFIDGLIIAGSFLVDISLGIVVSVAVILHEIPQEISDFGVLLYGGFKKTRALLLNFVSALSAVVGGVVGFYFFSNISDVVPMLMAFAAGNFIYIAAADLMPELKQGLARERLNYFAVMALGIFLIITLGIIIKE